MLFSKTSFLVLLFYQFSLQMAIRIVGVDLPQNKRGEIALTYIYGIGRSSSARQPRSVKLSALNSKLKVISAVRSR